MTEKEKCCQVCGDLLGKEFSNFYCSTGCYMKDMHDAVIKRDSDDSDVINHPTHYNSHPAKCDCGKRIECIMVTRHMGFNLGNVVKYIWRSDLKGGLEDLKKAQWYLADEIKKLDSNNDR